ncbi:MULTISPECIES: DUF6343 family protein [Streptomyces]|uniref:DUF6343 family protein n=1 Tax=Streptomyces yunnanensis TaxID=156453 RepID=A0ABY8AI42_9ACTN|nr:MULTISPECIES: DUF6343 family protein [Streptomyces]QRX91698.1 hypothetical protein JNO44_13340 [Streptomyces noursei]UJB41473.1 hypothetical protein HRD51_12055 [Streptomyces sp. A1-5]WEB43167.1 DUF6343 family protein [Streptomyces yunnanensis]
MRSGDEPLHARSPLRIRCGLALWGLLWAVAGTVAFVMAGRPQWAAACAALAAVAAADLVMVIRHIRQGPHYQPGRNIPPYEPDRGRNEIRRAAGRRRDSRP